MAALDNRRSTTAKSDFAAACSSASNLLSFTCPFGSATNRVASGLLACATSAKNVAASGNSCTTAKARVNCTESRRSAIGQGQSRIDPAIELQFGESTLQLVNHLRLHIEANDAVRCA